MIQTTNNHPGEPTCREISAETMKMPDPIIEPATSMVESSNPRPRMNLPLVGSDGDISGAHARRAGLIIRQRERAVFFGRDSALRRPGIYPAGGCGSGARQAPS